MKKQDVILICLLLTFFGLIYLLFTRSAEEGSYAEIRKNGILLGEYSLSEDRKIEIGRSNTLAIENGKIFMEKAYCPDKYCINMGKVSMEGEEIICLPNRVTVKIKGENNE